MWTVGRQCSWLALSTPSNASRSALVQAGQAADRARAVARIYAPSDREIDDIIQMKQIGVTPQDFLGPDVGRGFDTIVPIGTEPLMSRRESRLTNPGATWLHVIARLKPNQAIEAAQTIARGEPHEAAAVLRDRVDP